MKNPTAAIAALAASLVLLPSAPAKAQAHDSRPCVSLREFHGTHLDPAISLRGLEARWEVRGQRLRVPAAEGHVRPWYVYPMCGFDLSDKRAAVGTTLMRPGEPARPGRETVKLVVIEVLDQSAVCHAVMC